MRVRPSAQPNAHAAVRIDGALPGEIGLIESAHCAAPVRVPRAPPSVLRAPGRVSSQLTVRDKRRILIATGPPYRTRTFSLRGWL